MTLTRRAILGATTVAVGIAGCLGNGDTDEPVQDADVVGADEATIKTRSHTDHGDILVGPEDRTLYMFDQDTQGEGASTCRGDCAENWPPLTEDAPTRTEAVTAPISTFDRDDGASQVAADGWPIYYFADDEPGDATGQGVHDVWWVLTPDGAPVRPNETTSGDDNDDSIPGY